jgi:hypothetical protein
MIEEMEEILGELEQQQIGSYQVKWDASGFASGIYVYIIQAGEFQDVKKMILIK